MINQGQNVGYGTGNAYAFGSYINPNTPQVQAPAQPVVDPVAAPQAIPGINEYYQSISNLKAMAAQAKEMGIDITKPDYSDPERMTAYNLFLQAQGRVAALGNKLAKGATLEKELGERIAKGQTVVGQNFNFNVPLNEQYVMQNTRFAGMPQEVTNINNGLGKQAQTVSAYRAAMKDYSSARTMLQNRADAAKKAGQFQETAKYEDQINMLVRPRLENVSERQQAEQERLGRDARRATKLKEDELNVGANTVNFALNALEQPFETDAQGRVRVGKDGRPVTSQALKDSIGMVVGAEVPGIPNSEVMGTSVVMKDGRPALAVRYHRYEDSEVKIGTDGSYIKTGNKKRLTDEKGEVTLLYLDGESIGSSQSQFLNMVNEARAKRGEKQIGFDAQATDRSLNMANRRNTETLMSEDAVIQAVRKSGQPITAFTADLDNIASQMPGAQQYIKIIQSTDPKDPRHQEALAKYNAGLAGYRSYVASRLFNQGPQVTQK
jgi:hypothetical protein